MSKVAVLFSSRNRLEYSIKSIEQLIGHPDIDIYWFDGSDALESRKLPSDLMATDSGIVYVELDVNGGPDAAIVHALSHSDWQMYEWVILVENDIVVTPGWLDAMRDAARAATDDGLRVAGATVRVYADRILSATPRYNLMFNSGAGMLALRPSAVTELLKCYRTSTFGEIRRDFYRVTGIDIGWSFSNRRRDDTLSSADWLFDALLYRTGSVVVAPVVSWCEDIDEKHYSRLAPLLVRHESDIPNEARTSRRSVQGANSSRVAEAWALFQRAPWSGGSIIPVHALELYETAPAGCSVSFRAGEWASYWNQLLGPFGIIGSGNIELSVITDSTFLLVNFNEKLKRDVSSIEKIFGPYKKTAIFTNYALLELKTRAKYSDVVELEFRPESPGIIGLIVPSDVATFYSKGFMAKNFLSAHPVY
jgi:hypothetical protein